MLYHVYDLYHASLTPARYAAEFAKVMWENPFLPMSHTPLARTITASAEVFERATRRFGEPEFGLRSTKINGRKVKITEENVLEKPFCNLLNFHRHTSRNDPKVLLVAPMSGHFATLLRGTVDALLPHHDVYITDWIDARQVPLKDGKFDVDMWIKYMMEFIDHLGPDVHVVGVCQPAPLVLATVSLMAARGDKNQPSSMTLMGGPIDPRVSKTAVTELAENRPLSWFEQTVIADVPWYYPGGHRKVYPGFIQLSGFMSMNLDRHLGSSVNFFNHLIQGDGESAETHRKFYNEYLAVMDLPAEFYLQTVSVVFQKHLLPLGKMKWKDPETEKLHDVDPSQIKKTALLTIEGEKDDISALGQTMAAHDLTPSLAANKHHHHLQLDVGHYGIFNGSRWRQHIMPRIRNFIRQMGKKKYDSVPQADLKVVPNRKPELWNREKHFVKTLAEKEKADKMSG